MKNLSRILAIAIGVAALASTSGFCASATSSLGTVNLSASLPESLSITVTATGGVSFNLTPNATSTGNQPVTIQTTWALSQARTSLTLTGWFSTTSALTGSASSFAIPTSAVLGQVTTGSPTTFTAFTQSPGTGGLGEAGASLALFTESMTNGSNTNRGGSRTDSLNLEINLQNVAAPADTYTGTLNIQAQAL